MGKAVRNRKKPEKQPSIYDLFKEKIEHRYWETQRRINPRTPEDQQLIWRWIGMRRDRLSRNERVLVSLFEVLDYLPKRHRDAIEALKPKDRNEKICERYVLEPNGHLSPAPTFATLEEVAEYARRRYRPEGR